VQDSSGYRHFTAALVSWKRSYRGGNFVAVIYRHDI